MTISIIAAVAENNVIGNKNELPWRLPADLQHFSALTRGHPVIMGRKTYESIAKKLGKALPDRTNIIITRSEDFTAPGCIVVHSLDEAFVLAEKADEAFVIGGAEIYTLALPAASKLYLTKVHARPKGDAFFPDYDKTKWVLESSEKHQRDERNEFDYTFLTFSRKY